MKIIEIRAYEGKNLYCLRPVVKMVLDLGEYTGVTTDQIKDFPAKLTIAIPSLNEHFCSRGRRGGFVERLHEGTLLGHVVEHIALELQTLAGFEVIYGKTRQRDNKAYLYDIIFEYKAKEGAFQAAKSAVTIVKALLEGKEFSLAREVEAIKEVARMTELGPSTGAIARAALERGIPVQRLGDGSILQLGYGKNQQRVEGTITQNTGCIGVDISCDKNLTKYLLDEGGIPVPPGAVIKNLDEALAVACKIGGPVTIKPYNGNQGKGVCLNLTSQAEIAKAYELAKNFSEKVLVEKHITGRNYRLLVIGGQVIAAAERIPPSVTGDGVSNIKELVDITNQDPRRGQGHEKELTKIKLDHVAIMNMAQKGFTPETIPEKGELVILRDSANLSTGGSSIDVTEEIHPDNADYAVRAARILGLDVAGVDIVTGDISSPMIKDGGAIIEVNASPGIRMHHYPSRGKSREVAKAIVQSLFSDECNGRIPIVSITGTNGKTTTTRLIGHILQLSGLAVGMTTTDGIYIKGKLVRPGDTTGPQSAKAVLRDPEVEAAVLETARGGIIRAGLGYDWSDVGIVTNISSDHLGQDGVYNLEDLTHVKSLVAEAVNPGGYCILNADDKYVVSISDRIRAKIIYFSLEPDNIIVRRHLGAGGKAVFIKAGSIVYAHGTKVSRLIGIRSIPLTLGGRALHNVQNVLAAVAGTWAINTPPELIKQGILNFVPDLVNNPGRLNLLEVDGFKVLVDYGHNIAGYVSILNLLPKLKAKRYLGVIGVPGDRLDQYIREIGRISGKGFHRLIIKEDADLRGRQPGEVAEILRQGAIDGGASPETMEFILSEPEAAKRALDLARPGDVVVIFYEKLNPILEIINARISAANDDAIRDLPISEQVCEPALVGGEANL